MARFLWSIGDRINGVLLYMYGMSMPYEVGVLITKTEVC